MFRRNFIKAAAVLVAAPLAGSVTQSSAAESNGIVKARSAYPMRETIDRITKDIAAKGIKLFDVIDQVSTPEQK